MQYASQNTAKRTLLPNIICCAICYPPLATKHELLPVIPLNTSYCKTNFPTQHTAYHVPQHDMFNEPPIPICCATCYPIGCRTQHAAHHLARHNMLPIILPDTTCCPTNCPTQYAAQHATQLAAQHNMLSIIWPDTTCYQTNFST